MRPYLVFSCFLLIYQAACSQQLANAGFEEWDTSGKKLRPLHWSASIDAALYHNPAGTAKEGTNSIVISTWYSYVPGHLFYGSFKDPDFNQWTSYTVPFTGKPVKLAGYYRYTHTVNAKDAAAGEVIIKDQSGDTLAVGRTLLDTATDWRKFEIPFTYHHKSKAASIAIHFVSGEKNGGMNDDSYPNRLYLDGLKLLYKKP